MDAVSEIRTLAEKRLAQFDASVDEFSGIIESRFSEDSDEPKTGLVVSSGELDADGLHPLTVTTVIVDSPAWQAGLRAGDRITHIGGRRIEHETAVVFRVITDGAAGPLQMRILRGVTPLTMTLERAPIACLQDASRSVDIDYWRERVAEMRRLSAMVRSGLNDSSVEPAIRYAAVHRYTAKLFLLLQEAGQLLTLQLTDAIVKRCRFEPAE